MLLFCSVYMKGGSMPAFLRPNKGIKAIQIFNTASLFKNTIFTNSIATTKNANMLAG